MWHILRSHGVSQRIVQLIQSFYEAFRCSVENSGISFEVKTGVRQGLNNYLSPKSNFRLARYKLRTMRQEPDETVDSFVKKIRILVEECYFTNPDEHIIDALIFGSNSKRTQTKLLEKMLHLPLMLHWTLPEPKKLQANKLKAFQAMFLLVSMH